MFHLEFIQMTFTHAIFVRVSDDLKVDKKANVDVSALQKQQEDLIETLRESGVKIIDLNPSSNDTAKSLFVDDAAVVINGTALICRSKQEGVRLDEIKQVLGDLSWTVVDCPETVNDKPVVLEGCDVLFTDKEIFVGIRKNGTNMEGAIVLGRVFCDITVIPIQLPDKSYPLKYYVSVAGKNILSIGTSDTAQMILNRMEQEATFRYQVLRVDEPDAVSCLYVNGRIVFRQDKNEPKFVSLQSIGLQLWSLDVPDLSKLAQYFGRYCLLVRQIKL